MSEFITLMLQCAAMFLIVALVPWMLQLQVVGIFHNRVYRPGYLDGIVSICAVFLWVFGLPEIGGIG